MGWIGTVSARARLLLFPVLILARTRLSKEDCKALENLHMVETSEQVDMGMESGALLDKDYWLVQDALHRICAPAASTADQVPQASVNERDQATAACILWTKVSADDDNPTWDKVVSFIRWKSV